MQNDKSIENIICYKSQNSTGFLGQNEQKWFKKAGVAIFAMKLWNFGILELNVYK